jgi:hypothetical protein
MWGASVCGDEGYRRFRAACLFGLEMLDLVTVFEFIEHTHGCATRCIVETVI